MVVATRDYPPVGAGALEPSDVIGPAAATDRLVHRVIAVLSAVVVVGVAIVVLTPRARTAGEVTVLPAVNAALNGASTVLLLAGYAFIRRRRITAHRTCMLAALGTSSLFLVTYLVHHARVGSVPFSGPAWLRPLYLTLLIPHILLAAVVVPLALTTIARAWTGSFDRHRRLARVTLPVWLYVSVSGVAVYVLLYHVGR